MRVQGALRRRAKARNGPGGSRAKPWPCYVSCSALVGTRPRRRAHHACRRRARRRPRGFLGNRFRPTKRAHVRPAALVRRARASRPRPQARARDRAAGADGRADPAQLRAAAGHRGGAAPGGGEGRLRRRHRRLVRGHRPLSPTRSACRSRTPPSSQPRKRASDAPSAASSPTMCSPPPRSNAPWRSSTCLACCISSWLIPAQARPAARGDGRDAAAAARPPSRKAMRAA